LPTLVGLGFANVLSFSEAENPAKFSWRLAPTWTPLIFPTLVGLGFARVLGPIVAGEEAPPFFKIASTTR
jgi:hypothetical protein